MNRPFDFLKFSRIAGAVAAAWLIGQGVAAQPKVPAGDPAKGQQIASQVCGACHAADGNSTIATNPRLAGQSAEYLVKQLTDLAKPAGDKTGRENAVMSAFAMTLSDADRRSVAAWFSSQTPKASLARDKEVAELGARIYRTGIPEKAGSGVCRLPRPDGRRTARDVSEDRRPVCGVPGRAAEGVSRGQPPATTCRCSRSRSGCPIRKSARSPILRPGCAAPLPEGTAEATGPRRSGLTLLALAEHLVGLLRHAHERRAFGQFLQAARAHVRAR